ncbi:enoyl-[acyl-carrier-protein] reductase FabK [Halanaerobium congolense]|jgi:enoyl-[acyl-carrier protein] reductase II|uniref:Probable nitronate monooxygenase n=1 Tax=Halanaerobium congolense TaxID=54121 RepID=A0A1G6HR05_9FIRM|nr:enoyl-[acyl-carrier-protein] reductase FabK [Halanaerobium congolense]KXS50078.1 MAG: enoyl-[acyl carrier protein] reductase II [Halanaerobium sp. T82-1]OEG63057.1 MAG: 2-nitropropane dioxygenase [Halanaerobium sp. MDAL1]PTX16917.1 enoyl-[acyl-carrier protein] reductase II [Halanaerobium congolense]PXV69920.1 enoyl-[acyl-carrier protein] reductase II [Halanaerobium congolense]TDP26887.1 enoyl-[acyl-carrier protein] reductase II [Halanaerobium congolense]
MALKTELCDLLEIEKPIIQGGMAWVATGELAAAVSNAGGLGVIGAGSASADVIEKEINKVRKLTDKPFGLNIMLLSPFAEDIIDLAIAKEVPVITTGAGNPGKYVKRFQEIGSKVIPVVPSVALAKRMARLDVDAVIAEGTEAGGHVGELTTMALVPQVVDAVDIPVIAAGGVGDGRGLAAILALGASGVQIGTRFVCSEECTASLNFKKAIVGARDRDAVVTGRSTGHPVRNLKNKLTKEMDKLESQGVDPKKIEEIGSGKLRDAVIDGNVKEGSVMAGQISGMISEIKSVKEIIEEILLKAEETIKSNYNLLN